MKQIERRRKYRTNLFRYRWLYAAGDIIGLAMFSDIFWRERVQWPLLLNTRTWEHPYSGDGLPLFVICFTLSSLGLCRMWYEIGQYRQEQVALEQQWQMQDAAHAPGVWPPPPHKPDVL